MNIGEFFVWLVLWYAVSGGIAYAFGGSRILIFMMIVNVLGTFWWLSLASEYYRERGRVA